MKEERLILDTYLWLLDVVPSLSPVQLFVTPRPMAHYHGFSSKERVSLNFMAAITVCDDFGPPPTKISGGQGLKVEGRVRL